jgi:hypothetical protein
MDFKFGNLLGFVFTLSAKDSKKNKAPLPRTARIAREFGGISEICLEASCAGFFLEWIQSSDSE